MTAEFPLHPEQIQAATLLSAKVRRVLVTGAGGFLGKALCRQLLSAGIEVVGIARSDYPALEAMGVTMHRGDISDLSSLKTAMAGCELVFHVASKAGVWGSRDSYYVPNVTGAANVIEAAKSLGIQAIVYTSTPSVTFDGKDEAGIDESAPYASGFLNHYGASKAEAEAMMLGAHCDALKVAALRPHLIWGPEDPHLVPRVIARARAGRLKLLGSEDKLVDTIYVDNAAHAHVLAALALLGDQKDAGGRAFFLSNDEPLTMAAMLGRILECDGQYQTLKRVPVPLAYGVGALLEGVYHLLGKEEEPMMTRFVARQLSCSHYYRIDAAKDILGYRPLVSIDEGMARLKSWLAAQHAERKAQ
ncbi:NAD-dependent epimerase/dehydratase family protein [Shewanella sp. JM162201]|uniref:NAD-dependent epimerase/dehydratase family protein n=1 Tax=Shewanella jiangmenensis TaxID=2837387 RepID=A0ABS5V706_9GAMM|nr:2-alkyl-3-oxoalkanoate reductase [Shewanella jiangmenensis]MBT1444808.1 NAD-dependent epimerase/dehydratase family protein [Shewanella jiangmenensis]